MGIIFKMYLNFSEVNDLHLEFTNKCNAACPMCCRNNFGGKVDPHLIPAEWTLELAKKVLCPEFINLNKIMICGTYGDPVMAQQCFEIVQYFKQNSKVKIELFTNGSLRNEAWWSKLGQLLSHEGDEVAFSIDGLSDTNHIYRRKTIYEKIIKNAKAFITAGGRARWDFIVFKHNEHQVEEAQKLAAELDFKAFRVRKTSRFFASPDGKDKYRVLKIT
jgi:MoaA/NifB/PqqE/SkfB family radical SAM enzyme